MIQLTGIEGAKKECLYVFFTARSLNGFEVDGFHWLHLARQLDCTAYFLRDTSNRFYRGPQSKPFLRLLQPLMANQKTIFIGSSMGAYAAMLWGYRLKPSKVIAFTPAPPKGDKLHEKAAFPPMDIHVCASSKWQMTNELNDIENALLFKDKANIIYHDGNKHNVAAVLKERGQLMGIIRDEG